MYQYTTISMHIDKKTAVIDAQTIVKSYGTSIVLKGVSCKVSAGERLALTGPSGSGKTTLLNCLGGLDHFDSGTILFSGTNLHALNSTELARLRREKIGTVFQFFNLLPTLTVTENIELPLQLTKTPKAERIGRVQHLLSKVGLLKRGSAYPSELSGGEQQRIAIARALAHKPDLILADEPTGNLDSVSGQSILTLFREITDDHGPALIIVTHSEEVAAICHRRIHLKDGVILRES